MDPFNPDDPQADETTTDDERNWREDWDEYDGVNYALFDRDVDDDPNPYHGDYSEMAAPDFTKAVDNDAIDRLTPAQLNSVLDILSKIQ